MGLGKTLQAIAVASYFQSEWPLLIIVPSSLRYAWIEELEKWLPDILPQDINLIQGGFDTGQVLLSVLNSLFCLQVFGKPSLSHSLWLFFFFSFFPFSVLSNLFVLHTTSLVFTTSNTHARTHARTFSVNS